MKSEDIAQFLNDKGIRPTVNRILVMRELLSSSHPVSLSDLEISLAPMDKASIFRVLDMLAQKDITHVIEDGSRSLKYELCHNAGHHTVDDQHAHFYCEECGTIVCMDNISLPQVELDAGYKVKSMNLMFKGRCPKCNGN